jgi:hypothetical protein
LFSLNVGSIWSKHRLRYFAVFTISCKATRGSFKPMHYNTGLRVHKTSSLPILRL